MNERQIQIIRKKRLERIKRKKRKAKIYKALFRVMTIIIVLMVLVLVIRMFTKKDELKGTWDCDGITAYQFDGKGKGALIVPDSTYIFDYEINEDEVHIDFEDESALDYTYKFYTSKGKLVLSGSEGKESFSYELTKTED